MMQNLRPGGATYVCCVLATAAAIALGTWSHGAAQTSVDAIVVSAAPVKAHTGVVPSLAISADGKRLVTGSGGGTNDIKIWSLPDGKLLRTLHGTPGKVMTLGPSGLETAKGLGHSQGVSFVGLTADGLTLASGSFDNTVKLWDVGSGKILSTLAGSRKRNVPRDEYIGGLIVTGNRHVIYSDDFGIHVRTVVGQKLVAEVDTGWVYPILGASPDGKLLASSCTSCFPAGNNQKLTLRSLPTLKVIAEVDPQDTQTGQVAFTADGKSLLTLGFRTIRMWSVPELKLLETLPQNRNANRIAFSPKGDLLAVTYQREKGMDVVHLWSLPGYALVTRFEMPPEFGAGTAVAFTPDGSTLIVGGQNGHVALFDAATRAFKAYLADPEVK